MKKNIFTTFAVLLLAGCEPKATETTSMYKLPDELSDCSVYYLTNSDGNSMTVMRCPNSSTMSSYTSGKIKKNVILTEVGN